MRYEAVDAGPADGSGRRTFIRAQLIGWPVLGVVYYMTVAPFQGLLSWSLFGFKMIWSVIGMAVSTGLAVLYRACGMEDRTISFVVAVAILASTAAAMPWVLGLGGLAFLVNGTTDMMFTRASFPFVASNHVFILLAWSGAYLTLVFWRRSEAEARKALSAAALARDAQLEMLRYQLEPHFLFNALASVRALVTEDPFRARETITRLSEFLRYTLSRDSAPMSTVSDEIDVVRDYLSIEKVRFEDRLQVDIEMEPAAAGIRIPAFLLHPLVENAIKHGPTAEELTVGVSVVVRGDRLILEVRNNGRLGGEGRAETSAPGGDPRGSGAGIGLQNIRDRLAAAFPGRSVFSLHQDGSTVLARVTIEVDADGRV